MSNEPAIGRSIQHFKMVFYFVNKWNDRLKKKSKQKWGEKEEAFENVWKKIISRKLLVCACFCVTELLRYNNWSDPHWTSPSKHFYVVPNFKINTEPPCPYVFKSTESDAFLLLYHRNSAKLSDHMPMSRFREIYTISIPRTMNPLNFKNEEGQKWRLIHHPT